MRSKRAKHTYQGEKDVHRITLYNTVYPEHQHSSIKERLYLHFDFACFYAQVEQLRKNLYGIPVIIGGWRKPDGTVKGIVATSSYEARAFGIKTGVSALEAYKMCPHIVMLQVDYDTYTSISTQVHYIMKDFSDQVERYSMDEYFLDLTPLKDRTRQEIVTYVQQLQQRIFDTTGLVGSLGIARSKTYAKLSSGLNKPKGITPILDDTDEKQFVHPLDLNEVWGVGRRRYQHLLNEGFKTIRDVIQTPSSQDTFKRLFGANFGKMLHQSISGKDQGRILTENDDYTPKHGLTYGHTFSEGSSDIDRIRGEFAICIQQLCYRMRAYNIRANSFSGMFGYNNLDLPGVGFRFVTPAYTNIDDYIFEQCMRCIMPKVNEAVRMGRQIRNIVLGTHHIDKTQQLNIFFQDEGKHVARYKAIDEIKNRFGHKYITKANTLLRVQGNTHFLERNA